MTGAPPLTVMFSDLSTTDPGYDIVSWAWDLGDGSSSDEMNPTHTYNDQGYYTVSLTVTDGVSTSFPPPQATTNTIDMRIAIKKVRSFSFTLDTPLLPSLPLRGFSLIADNYRFSACY